MWRLFHLFLITIFFLSGCNFQTREASADGIPSPTPFQPGQTASDSLYAGSAPTPLSLLTIETPITVPTEIPAIQAIGPTAVPLRDPVNPLTGLPPSDPALLNRRPLAIKIANYPRYIRPQSGLTLADHVYEYYIEQGLTRFVAVFYGNDSEWVGPVRSGRFFDENIQRMYQSFLVFKFADRRVLGYFQNTDFADYLVVPSNDDSCPPFHVMTSRDIEFYNNSYFNTFAWQDCIERDNLNNDPPAIRAGLFHDSYLPVTSLPGDKIFTYYSVDDYHYWTFVPETGEYARYQETDDTRNGKPEAYMPLVDAINATAIHASNVVILFAYHTFADPFDADDEVYHIGLTDSGEAYVFRDGVGIAAHWRRTYADQPLTLTETNGLPIYLKPGNTFYEVIGTNSYMDQGDGEWIFHHETP